MRTKHWLHLETGWRSVRRFETNLLAERIASSLRGRGIPCWTVATPQGWAIETTTDPRKRRPS
jgi:hypothetical protein